jgi:uncharacterized SAM-binding protein YcdF (DUF218 family)
MIPLPPAHFRSLGDPKREEFLTYWYRPAKEYNILANMGASFSPENRLGVNLGRLQKETDRVPLSGRVLFVFGQGPVVDNATRLPPNSATAPGTERGNFWLEDLAIAASVLYRQETLNHHKFVNRIVLLGGRTGGNHYKAESELMAEILREFGVPPENIEQEKESKYTVDNIINFLNLYDSHGEIERGDFSVMALTAPFHATRTRLMLGLFALPHQLLTSESVQRYAARLALVNGKIMQTNESPVLCQERLKLLDEKMNVNAVDLFYGRQKGNEANDIVDKFWKEALFTIKLLAYPEVWLSQLYKLHNSQRISKILALTQELYPEKLQEYGIDLPEDPEDRQAIAQLRAKLMAIAYHDEDWKEDMPSWIVHLANGNFLPDDLLTIYNRLLSL